MPQVTKFVPRALTLTQLDPMFDNDRKAAGAFIGKLDTRATMQTERDAWNGPRVACMGVAAAASVRGRHHDQPELPRGDARGQDRQQVRRHRTSARRLGLGARRLPRLRPAPTGQLELDCAQFGDSLVQNVCCRHRPGSGAEDDIPDHGTKTAFELPIRRWALEEVGQAYEVRLVSFRAMKEAAHLALHPFGQIPTYEEGDLALFETGAIVLHIAERHAGLLPDEANARARAITWTFAALSTVEPPILELANARLLEGDKPWSAQRMPLVQDRVRNRLDQLSRCLMRTDWLDGAFSAGDLMMVSVLLRLKASGMLDEYPNLSAYVARGEPRPAYKRAFDAQLAVFTGNLSPGLRE